MFGRRLPWALAVAALTVLTIHVPGAAAAAADVAEEAGPGATTRVDLTASGAQTSTGGAGTVISANGRFVIFVSDAPNLAASTPGTGRVYLRDRWTNGTRRLGIPRASFGEGSTVVGVSDDGGTLLVRVTGGVDEDSQSVAVRDVATGRTTLIGKLTSIQFSHGWTTMTPDARYVTFSTEFERVPGDGNPYEDVIVVDRTTGTRSIASVGTGGTPADGPCSHPSLSADGRYVVFESDSSTLVPGDTNGATDVFVRDRTAGTLTRVSVASDGTQAGGAVEPSISADGRYVVFISDNLVPGDTNQDRDVYVHDLRTGTTTQASVSTSGAQSDDDWSYRPLVSRGGRFVAFLTFSRALVTGDDNATDNIVVRDLVAGTTTLADVTLTGLAASGGATDPFSRFGMSADGRAIVFSSPAPDLVRGDTNASGDVFVRDVLAPPTPFGDFDGDGQADILVRQRSTGALWLYPGVGNTFAPRIRVGTGWAGISAMTRLGDLTGDGHEDVVAREAKTGSLWLYPGTGRGFGTRLALGAYGWNAMREISAVGDLTRDGRPDLLAVQTSTGYLYLYPGAGTNARPSLGARQLLSTWRGDFDELTGVGDVSGDGHPDLVARNPHTGELWTYPGLLVDGRALLGRPVRIGAYGWTAMRDLTGVGDFDRDGHTDLVTVQTSTGALRLYHGGVATLQSGGTIGSGWTTDLAPVL